MEIKRYKDISDINKYPKFFTVGDLKKMLEQFDDDTPVGVSGHFGEFHPMDSGDFYKSRAYPLKKNQSWRSATNRNTMEILHINCPDIGPDPD